MAAQAPEAAHYARVGSGDPIILLPKIGGWIADWRMSLPFWLSAGQ